MPTGRSRSRAFPRIASPATAPVAAASGSDRRSYAASAQSASSASASPSSTSRFRWTSCQTTYGCSVAISRGDEADARRAEPRPDREDDECRRDRDGDLREPDREPRATERQVDRREEPAVERLRVRRRDAGEEAERPVIDERRREAVALVDELLEDRLPLACEHEEPRDGRDDDDDERQPSTVSSSFGVDGRHVAGTVRGRLLPR